MSLLNDDDFTAVRRYLLAAAGLAFDDRRREGLAAVIADRRNVTGAPDVPTYLALLAGHHDEAVHEAQDLIDAVTVQETQFFRNGPQMEALRRRVLPELLRRTAGRERPLTIWSAGCSTGEEAYTLAMIVLDLAPRRTTAPVRIVATDVSAGALRAAGRAIYVGRSVEAVPPIVRGRWFEPAKGGALAVRDEVRALVELRRHNLVTEAPPFAPAEVDLIVCRNVTIYFERDTTARLIGTFHDVLAPEGYLVLGHAETLWQVSDAFSLVPIGDAFVYQPTREPAVVAPRPKPKPRPPSATVVLAEARRHLAAGDYRAAAGRAETAVRADPLLAPAYVVLGRARASLGQDQAAVAPLRKAVYLDPTAGDAHFLLGGSLSRLGRRSAAAASYRAAAATVSDLDESTRRELLDGRAVAELVQLCLQLAQGLVESDAEAAR